MGLKINIFLAILILSSLRIELIHEFENFIKQNKMKESFSRSVSSWQLAITVTLPNLNL